MAALSFRGGSLFSRGGRNSFSLLLSRLNPKHDPSSLLLPSLLVSSRGIAHKLFVGGVDPILFSFSQLFYLIFLVEFFKSPYWIIACVYILGL